MFAKTFRNTLIASSLLVGASILASPAALAIPTDTDNGSVGGDVEIINTVVFDNSAYVPATTTLTATPNMGTLTVANNALGGWTLKVKSASGGQLRHSAHTVETPVYVTYTALTASGAPAGSGTTSVATLTTLDQNLVVAPYSPSFATTAGDDITIAATLGTGTVGATSSVALGSLPAGTYSDTLTFTLTSNQ